MKWIVSETPEALGRAAASHAARLLRQAIEANGEARLLLSTGASQFTTLQALLAEAVDWSRVEMFHLDEYLGMDEGHPASFVRYLKERFAGRVPLKAAWYVRGTGDADKTMRALADKLAEAPVDVGLIGIGENAHIAFNDPPADFETTAAFKLVTLDDACRRQQLGEGWFATLDDVPRQAITMTVHQMLKCGHILCPVPYAVKAEAIRAVASAPGVTNLVPATALRRHADVTVYLDRDSASLTPPGLLR